MLSRLGWGVFISGFNRGEGRRSRRGLRQEDKNGVGKWGVFERFGGGIEDREEGNSIWGGFLWGNSSGGRGKGEEIHREVGKNIENWLTKGGKMEYHKHVRL